MATQRPFYCKFQIFIASLIFLQSKTIILVFFVISTISAKCKDENMFFLLSSFYYENILWNYPGPCIKLTSKGRAVHSSSKLGQLASQSDLLLGMSTEVWLLFDTNLLKNKQFRLVGVGVGKKGIIRLTQSSWAGAGTELGNSILYPIWVKNSKLVL